MVVDDGGGASVTSAAAYRSGVLLSGSNGHIPGDWNPLMAFSTVAVRTKALPNNSPRSYGDMRCPGWFTIHLSHSEL